MKHQPSHRPVAPCSSIQRKRKLCHVMRIDSRCYFRTTYFFHFWKRWNESTADRTGGNLNAMTNRRPLSLWILPFGHCVVWWLFSSWSCHKRSPHAILLFDGLCGLWNANAHVHCIIQQSGRCVWLCAESEYAPARVPMQFDISPLFLKTRESREHMGKCSVSLFCVTLCTNRVCEKWALAEPCNGSTIFWNK